MASVFNNVNMYGYSWKKTNVFKNNFPNLLHHYTALISPHTLHSRAEGGVPGLNQSSGHFSSGLSVEGEPSRGRRCRLAAVDTRRDVPLRKTLILKQMN